ncbi:MAG: class I SAM-dependent methyltransferase [Methanophagales archaeon]|nr:class I SAM-dependent methyltransferase [Methanophagales archaeon]
MKKKPGAQDFVIGTYPINAYPDPWDFAVDKYDIRSKGRRLWIKDEIYAELVKNLFEGGNCKTILDIGCGAGTLSIPLADWFNVYSLYFSRSMLKRLKTRAKELKKGIAAIIKFHGVRGEEVKKDEKREHGREQSPNPALKYRACICRFPLSAHGILASRYSSPRLLIHDTPSHDDIQEPIDDLCIIP